MTSEENRADLQRHADDFRNRKGFTDTVLDPRSRGVIGQSYAHLDTPLWRAVSEWLESDWPFGSVQYAPRASA